MRVSLEWLNEYVNLDGLQPETIAEALTNAGLEVETIETVGGIFSGVIVGKIETVSPHPNADRLRLVQVNLGAKGQNQVVCGAPNVAPGMRIAYAQIGAQVINRKEGGLFELKPIKIRGIESTGMICSLEELGLDEQYTRQGDGIWPINDLTEEADLGKDLKEVLQLKPDTVLDVTPNANRGDLMSMLGVAREVSALFKRPFKGLQPKAFSSSSDSNYQIQLTEPGICRYYGGAVLENVQVGESPDWMRQRLVNAGIRAINNVVDITNYVMLEFGQPLHAFDIQKLGSQGTINVRYAKPNETFLALDGVNRQLMGQSVVVTFNDHSVALGGVMGGEETEISESTSTVFLESAFFPPASNRRSARSVGIRTESSARFERGVDPLTCQLALHRAIELLEKYAQASFKSLTEDDHRRHEKLEIPFSLSRLARILGLAISAQDVEAILQPLGFEIKPTGDPDQRLITVPSFRSQDVYREIDLIEEVIRIYGYDAIPYTLPKDTIAPVQSFRSRLLKAIRMNIRGAGLSEVATHSLIGEGLLQRTGFSQDLASTVSVTNSQSQDHTFLRQSILPNLLEIAKYNQAQGNEEIWLFELGKTYFKRRLAQEKDAGIDEPLHLSGLIMNSPRQGIWHQQLETDFYTIKGVLENLLDHLNVKQQCRWVQESTLNALHPGQTAKIKLGKIELGFVGKLHPALQEELKFKSAVYLFEINVEVLYEHLQKKPEVLAVESAAAFPSVRRDIAFSAPDTVTHQQVVAALRQTQEPLLQEIQLFDEYRGTQLEHGYRSLAYRLTLQSPTETLTEQEIEAAMGKLKRQLSEQLPVSFR